MKTAGDILSVLFDEKFINKAQGYSKLFDSWRDITAKNGIAAAADHSWIKDLDKGILLVEMDHPGWKQIIQTKQSKLLNDFRYRFPELDISAISLMLGNKKPDNEAKEEIKENKQSNSPVVPQYERVRSPEIDGIDSVKDNEFKEMLISLGQSIAEREKR